MGKLTWTDIASLAVTFVTLPFVMGWEVSKLLVFPAKGRGVAKTALSASVRHLMSHTTTAQIQALSGTSRQAYEAWAKRNKLPITVESLVDGSALFWIGTKRTDRVVLYVHGGGYFSPLTDMGLNFMSYLKKQLQDQGVESGFAVLQYSLLPDVFPTQLRQISVAVDHLLATGLDPSNLQLIGDSAGGNLLVQFLSHLAHPIENIGPITPFKSPLAGVCLVSPWVKSQSTSLSFTQSSSTDILSDTVTLGWGKDYFGGVQESLRPYVEPIYGPIGWFQGITKYAPRLLVTAGEEERFKDDIVDLVETRLSPAGVDVEFLIVEGGTHDDPCFDFFLSPNPASVHSSVRVVVDWIKEGLVPGRS
ncbi:alpha/beta hydrolase fold protein [Coprinopsis marcescibilis]|uniref:Alpha/beta hydrolase fold protein n=1 Tax=Coprinopsis marcescibilis TaxID=230819 RepID=A0A5C3L2W9_COPMA|nr:alpha/beta hydrolase fold protein [Coprinopsis marcescibilis]